MRAREFILEGGWARDTHIIPAEVAYITIIEEYRKSVRNLVNQALMKNNQENHNAEDLLITNRKKLLKIQTQYDQLLQHEVQSIPAYYSHLSDKKVLAIYKDRIVIAAKMKNLCIDEINKVIIQDANNESNI